MNYKQTEKGFSLIELMITVAVVAILLALALPSYTHYIRKANRGEAQQLLLNWANNQEIWRAAHTTYAAQGSNLGVPSHTKYTFTVTGTTGTAYLLTATATGSQANDKEKGQSCTILTLNQSNTKTHATCW